MNYKRTVVLIMDGRGQVEYDLPKRALMFIGLDGVEHWLAGCTMDIEKWRVSCAKGTAWFNKMQAAAQWAMSEHPAEGVWIDDLRKGGQV